MPRRKTSSFKLEKVTVRMYRPGLGDCFLLTFAGRQAGSLTERHMLIDCGVLQGTAGGSERLRKIILDIQQRTGGKLEALIVTHEHADHLSGFVDHQQLFQSGFKVEQFWLGWTEDKDDPAVMQMYSTVRKVPLQVLQKALEELEKAGSPNAPYYQQLTQFLKDNGMEAVKGIARAQRKQPLYLSPEPGEQGPTRVIERPDLGGVRFHVLGPPLDPAKLTRSDPPKTRLQLDQGMALNQATAFSAAVLKLMEKDLPADSAFSAEDVKELFELSLPFDSSQGIPLAALTAQAAAALPAAADDQAPWRQFLAEKYLAEDAAWQRIDADWLESAGALALYLDGDINNTSLVLAIELGAGGKVLLFAGDAQYGNWLSWAETPRGQDLLRRTVLYKVGHHGSHNATLIDGGLSLMGAAPGFDELTAMIPVDTEKAKTKRWRMPEQELREKLVKQARGRLILACEGLGGDSCADFAYRKPSHPPPAARISLADWKKFTAAIEADPSPDGLWVAYSLLVG